MRKQRYIHAQRFTHAGANERANGLRNKHRAADGLQNNNSTGRPTCYIESYGAYNRRAHTSVCEEWAATGTDPCSTRGGRWGVPAASAARASQAAREIQRLLSLGGEGEGHSGDRGADDHFGK